MDFSPQPLKNPHLRNVYQKLLFNSQGPTSIDGFGMLRDGHFSNINDFFNASAFAAYSATQAKNIIAYVLCFDTGTAPAVGFTQTLTSQNVTVGSVQTAWDTLQSQAAASNIDLIGRGTIKGQVHGMLYQPSTQTYVTDTNGLGPFTQTQLQALIVAGDTVSVMGVYPGTGTN